MIGFAFAGLLLGLILGVYCPFRVPPEYARLLALNLAAVKSISTTNSFAKTASSSQTISNV